jgi:hypothetical protein
MSYKASILKMTLKWTPKMMVLWVANFKLQGLAELQDWRLDLEERKA